MKFLCLYIIAMMLGGITFSQQQYRSARHGYLFEIPKGFTQKDKENIIGKNVDLSIIDNKGSSINIVVNIFEKQFINNLKLDDLNKIPTSEMQKSLSENLQEVNIIKRGITFIGSQKAFYMRYTFWGEQENVTYYVLSYQLIKKDKLYTINATCNKDDLSAYYEAIFFRAIQSFKY